jgi:uncharacterized membrane-anchored protein
MTVFGSNVWRAVALTAGLQIAALIYMVWSRVDLLSHGREITVDVIPVDPRDIFRGDYVVLGYPFANPQTGVDAETVTLPKGTHMNAAVYVTIGPDGSSWKRIAIDREYPAAVAPENVVLKGRVDTVWPGAEGQPANGRIRYGIESYFVPEGTGRELEQLVREKKIRAVLAIGSDGTAAIRALEVEGKRIHEQPVL